jgi:hypothetical protein
VLTCRTATALAKRYYDLAKPNMKPLRDHFGGFAISGFPTFRGYCCAIGGPVVRSTRRLNQVVKIHGPAFLPAPKQKSPPPTNTPPLCDPATPWIIGCTPPPPTPLSCTISLDPPTSGPDPLIPGNSLVQWHGNIDCNQSVTVAVHFWLTDQRIGPDGQGGVWAAPDTVYPNAPTNEFYNQTGCGPRYTAGGDHQGDGHTTAVTSGFVQINELLPGPLTFPLQLGRLIGTATSTPVPVLC